MIKNDFYICRVVNEKTTGWLTNDYTVSKIISNAENFKTIEEAKEFAKEYVIINQSSVGIEKVNILHYKPETRIIMILKPTENDTQIEIKTKDGSIIESYKMKLEEAKKILKDAGYIIE